MHRAVSLLPRLPLHFSSTRLFPTSHFQCARFFSRTTNPDIDLAKLTKTSDPNPRQDEPILTEACGEIEEEIDGEDDEEMFVKGERYIYIFFIERTRKRLSGTGATSSCQWTLRSRSTLIRVALLRSSRKQTPFTIFPIHSSTNPRKQQVPWAWNGVVLLEVVE